MKLDDHYVGWDRYFMQCSFKFRLNVCRKRKTSWPKSFFIAVISFKLPILGKSIYVYGCLDNKEMAKKLQHGL